MTDPTTLSLDLPGRSLRYDVRDAETKSTEPVLLMIGYPMAASGFTSLAELFLDRTVVTYDPAGVDRSEAEKPAGDSTPDDRAADLHELIAALGGDPVDIFASSGGAVNGLALVAKHPEQVRTLVAHEPPAASLLPDAEQASSAIADIHETYMRDGFGAGMAKFIALTGHKGPIPEGFVAEPVDVAAFGFPTEDDGKRDDPLMGRNIIATTHYEYDFDALRATPTRIVVGVGAESDGEMAHRGGLAVAERLGLEPVVFPSHHGGFLGGEFGWAGDPDAFAPKLREVLAG
ncbi:MAG: alpha/beta fold hydrolase [Solirubrobacterales bacterium]